MSNVDNGVSYEQNLLHVIASMSKTCCKERVRERGWYRRRDIGTERERDREKDMRKEREGRAERR